MSRASPLPWPRPEPEPPASAPMPSPRGWSPTSQAARATKPPSSRSTLTSSFEPRRPASPATSWAVEAIHTPGHLPDHLCFALDGQRHRLFRRSHHGLEHQHRGATRGPHGRLQSLARSAGGASERHGLLARSRWPGRATACGSPKPICCIGACANRRSMMRSSRARQPSTPLSRTSMQASILASFPPPRMSVLAHVEHLQERGLVRETAALSLNSSLAVV